MTALQTTIRASDFAAIALAQADIGARHPLNRCGCPNFHDQSASCASVADAARRGVNRMRIEAMIGRIAALQYGEVA